MISTPKIGITERGDAVIDLSWADKINTVDGAILITKNITNQLFQQKLLENKEKIILHADITGNGSTIFEPNVPNYETSFLALHDIINQGFPKEHIVLRCDPIIPNKIGFYNMTHMFTDFLKENFGITRIRISVLDNYPHTKFFRIILKLLSKVVLSQNFNKHLKNYLQKPLSGLVVVELKTQKFLVLNYQTQ